LFPEELHPYLDPAAQPKKSRPKKRGNSPLGLADLSDIDDEDGDKLDDDQDAIEEEQDDDFDEDNDSDAGGDYNAENYFDNGERDDDDVGGDDYD